MVTLCCTRSASVAGSVWGGHVLVFVLLVLAQTLHAFTFGTYHAAGVETVRRLFADSGQAGGQALYGAVSFGLGGALGSWLAGQLWRFGATLVFDLAALLCLLALVLGWYGFRDPRLRD